MFTFGWSEERAEDVVPVCVVWVDLYPPAGATPTAVRVSFFGFEVTV